MAINAPHGYVTTKGWGVSVHTTRPGKPAILHVSRSGDDFGFRPGDADRRQFPDRDAAWAYARSHGYVEAYRPVRGVWKSSHRLLCHEIAHVMRVTIQNDVADLTQVHAVGDWARDRARNAGCDILDSSMFQLAAQSIARRFRPELFERKKKRR